MKGSLQYILSFQYTLDSEGNTDMNPGIKLNYGRDHVSASLSYLYSYSKIDPTTDNPDPDPFISHDLMFGIQGKFFTVYTPTGRGEEPINIISGSPRFITADNDGKNDFTTITMTAFDETGINSWRLDITNTKGVIVNTIARKGAPPATLKWDGTDKTNILLPTGDYFCKLTIVNSAGKKSTSKRERIFLSRKKRAVTLEKSYTEFSPNKDGIRDTISYEINASDKEGVESWKLSIRDAGRKKGRPLREITGFEFLPYDVQWDGKNSRGELLKDGKYNASISIRYKDRKSIQSPSVEVVITSGVTIGIRTDRGSFTPGKTGVVITPGSSKADLESWKLMVHSMDKRLIKQISGSGKVPGKISWNGTDDKNRVIGYNMPVLISMEVADKAGNRGKSESREVWIDFLITRSGGKTRIILFDQGILHKTKSASFKAEAGKIITQLVTALKKQGQIRVVRIFAHTNSDGSEKNNIALSKKRAVNLAERLKGPLGGVTIKTTGMGEAAPYKEGDSNRWDIRYEIEIN
jgi:outer membrane protein OmpA-like peptidoglycan-associated protein/flagellar hook assembly protein FlgD